MSFVDLATVTIGCMGTINVFRQSFGAADDKYCAVYSVKWLRKRAGKQNFFDTVDLGDASGGVAELDKQSAEQYPLLTKPAPGSQVARVASTKATVVGRVGEKVVYKYNEAGNTTLRSRIMWTFSIFPASGPSTSSCATTLHRRDRRWPRTSISPGLSTRRRVRTRRRRSTGSIRRVVSFQYRSSTWRSGSATTRSRRIRRSCTATSASVYQDSVDSRLRRVRLQPDRST